MQLQHLKHIKCPTCGALVVAEYKRNIRSTDMYEEAQSFSCGCHIVYFPNPNRMVKEKVKEDCPKSPEAAARLKEERTALIDIHKYISNLNVNEKFKACIRNALENF